MNTTVLVSFADSVAECLDAWLKAKTDTGIAFTLEIDETSVRVLCQTRFHQSCLWYMQNYLVLAELNIVQNGCRYPTPLMCCANHDPPATAKYPRPQSADPFRGRRSSQQ